MNEQISSETGYLCSMDECDFEGYKIFYHYLPRLKLQFNRDFKQYVTEAVKPINNNELVPIEALTKKDKKESSKSTLKLRKGKKEKIFGSNPTEDHFVKFKPLMDRIIQCNSNHEVFRKAGSKARQKKLVQKIEDDIEIDWNDVDPSDAVSILKTYIAELRTPLVCIEWEKTFQTLAESDCSTAEKTSILQALFLCLSRPNGKLFSKLMHLLNDTFFKSKTESCLESLATIVWPHILREVSLEIEINRSSLNRIRRDLSISLLKFIIENWNQINCPNEQIVAIIRKRYLELKPSQTKTRLFTTILPKKLRLRIDQSRSRNNTGQEVKSVPIRSSSTTIGSANYWSDKTFYRQKIRGASEQKANRENSLRGGDSTGCLTDGGTEDEDANNSSYIIESLKKSSNSFPKTLDSEADMIQNAGSPLRRPRSNARSAVDFEEDKQIRFRRRNTLNYYPHSSFQFENDSLLPYRRRSCRDSVGSHTIFL